MQQTNLSIEQRRKKSLFQLLLFGICHQLSLRSDLVSLAIVQGVCKNSVAVEAVQLPGDHSILGSRANTEEHCCMRNFTDIVTKKVQMFQKNKSKSKLPGREGCKHYCMCNKCPNKWLFQAMQCSSVTPVGACLPMTTGQKHF